MFACAAYASIGSLSALSRPGYWFPLSCLFRRSDTMTVGISLSPSPIRYKRQTRSIRIPGGPSQRKSAPTRALTVVLLHVSSFSGPVRHNIVRHFTFITQSDRCGATYLMGMLISPYNRARGNCADPRQSILQTESRRTPALNRTILV